MAAVTNQVTETCYFRTNSCGNRECIAVVYTGKPQTNGARIDKNKMKKINQSATDLVNGFIREHDEREKLCTPLLINYLTVQYWLETDNWDIDQLGYVFLEYNRVKCYGGILPQQPFGFAYLSNVVSSGVHIWIFRCNEWGFLDRIVLRRKDCDRWGKFSDDRPIPIDGPEAYSFNFRGGELSGKCAPNPYYPECQGIWCGIESNAFIEMIANFYTMTLSYKIDSIPVPCLTKKFQAGEYVAGVELSSGDWVELEHYHHVY